MRTTADLDKAARPSSDTPSAACDQEQPIVNSPSGETESTTSAEPDWNDRWTSSPLLRGVLPLTSVKPWRIRDR